jgi:hypothetical protein
VTEPSDGEMERAERIRKLRSGGARSRGHEMRELRREAADDAEAETDEDDEDENDSAASDDGTANGVGGGDVGGETAPLAAAGWADVMEMAASLPADGSLFVVPVHETLRREFNKVAEQLHLRYGFEYEHALDETQHVRTLALYLGVQTLDDADVEVVKELLESVDHLEAPGEGADNGEP